MKVDLMMLGPCGIYCGTCDIHTAGRDGDVETQTRIAEWVVEHCGRGCRAEQIRCGGCWGELKDHWSADCRILKCAKARGVKLCSSCGEYETCTTLHGFYDGGDYESAKRALERIREVGLKRWVAEMEEDLAMRETD